MINLLSVAHWFTRTKSTSLKLFKRLKNYFYNNLRYFYYILGIKPK